MSSTEQLFIALLRSDYIKDHLLPHLSTTDICAVREASSACCNLLTKRIFTRVHVTFNASTFTKPSRVAALSRIGHHIEHLTFFFPHSDATFLPPLVHPLTGQEISFLYKPHTSMDSVLTRPKYANTELGDILTQQYPPLFHSATNVPSFINALKLIPNMRHLTIRCPGQDPRERYRRDIVDYALISLRIAVERAPITKLNKLSLSSLHPSAFNYLRHLSGFGSVPSAGKRWAQIKKLHISVDSWDFYGATPGLDLLKITDDYVRTFAPSLEKFTFSWIGNRGPCPIALSADPLFAPPRSSKKLFHEVTSPMSPLPTRPCRSPIHFPKLRHMQIRNANMNSSQLSELVDRHQKTVKEFDFQNVVLTDNGSWDDALSPLGGNDTWSRSSLMAPSEYSLVTSESSDDLPSPSAAVAAASKDLLDLDLSSYGFSDEDKEVIESLSEDATTLREPSLVSFTTKLIKKRVRRRRRKENHQRSSSSEVPQSSPPSSPSRREDKSPKSPAKSHKKPSIESIKSSQAPVEPVSPPPQAHISAPILAADPQPVLLQPTVYDPAARRQKPNQEISSVQRNIEQEEAHRLLAEDADAQVSALRRAKEAVLKKLSREFCAKRAKATDAVAVCRAMNSRDLFGVCGREVLEDRRALESQSALVPLMFSRS